MREVPMEEFYNTAAACERMFPIRWHYLRVALRAATILCSAKNLTEREREYHTRVRNINVAIYRNSR